MRTIAPRLPGPEYMCGEDRLDVMPTCYQLAKTEHGRVSAVTRWTFSAAEREAIAQGFDIFVQSFLDDRPLPDMHITVGSPLEQPPAAGDGA